MLAMLRMAIDGARRNGRHVGICGQAPADYPERVPFLVQAGITSISVNPDAVLRTRQLVAAAERRTNSIDTPAAGAHPAG
jgi:pyruvate,water dikinase